MARKTFCDICEQDITHKNHYSLSIIETEGSNESSSLSYTQDRPDVCGDCIRAIEFTIKDIRKNHK